MTAVESILAADDGTDHDEGDEVAETRRAIVGDEVHGERLDKAIVAVAPEFSRSHLQRLVRDGLVTVDGEPVATPARKVRAGQAIEIVLRPTGESLAYRPESLPLRVVHEDEHLLVVDKAVGMVVHPAAGHWSGTLLNALLARDPASAGLPRAGIVHRLDKDTSGLMVVARTRVAMTALVRAIAAREVERRYAAIAHGAAPRSAFEIDAPIGRDPRTRTRMAVVPSGKPARTRVEPVGGGDGVAALRCTLETGRTHQIRVHLASRGMPLVGDRLYGGAPALDIDRQALHAERLAFVHPVTRAPLEFVAPLPSDLAPAWARLTGSR